MAGQQFEPGPFSYGIAQPWATQGNEGRWCEGWVVGGPCHGFWVPFEGFTWASLLDHSPFALSSVGSKPNHKQFNHCLSWNYPNQPSQDHAGCPTR